MVHSKNSWVARRAPRSNRLETATVLWLETLEQQGIAPPRHLFERFPHVLDKIAAAWGSALAMDELMAKDLLIDHRGGRHGFPFKVLIEIQALHHAHRTRHTIGAPVPTGWDSLYLRRNN
jgi:hypothetical protein